MSYNPTHYLRPEARPIPYWKHHKRAKATLDFIIRALSEAVALAKESKDQGDTHSIDRNRISRIVFISGEPGSGKSSLYLTLKEMLTSINTDYQEGYKVRVEEHPSLEGLKVIRWLDPLDLEVVGDEGENLLAAVLVRLFRKLEESTPGHSNKCDEAIKELEDLATDIGIAWEGNLKDRAATLDPDTFSTEVMRTQRARLGINERLKTALDDLAKNECYGCTENTLFLLPVDDFYLKPAASLNLLRLLRMISIPRLFFLVMGDIKTVEALFTEKSLADWTTVAGTNLFEDSKRFDGALTRARELRARYLRKLLPPGQRREVEAMDWHEALDFEVDAVETLESLLAKVKLDTPSVKADEVGGSNHKSEEARTSSQKHDKDGDSNKKSDSLLKFFVSPPFTYLTADGELDKEKYDKARASRIGRAKEEADTEYDESLEPRRGLIRKQSAYSAVQILDATPREMMDLASALRYVLRQRKEVKPEESLDEETRGIPRLLLGVSNIVDQVKEEQSFLNVSAQRILEGVLPTRVYSHQDITFDMDLLCLSPSRRRWNELESSSVKQRDSVDLLYRDHRSWDLTVCSEYIKSAGKRDKNENLEEKAKSSTDVSEPEHDDADPFAKLPPRPAAWFILLHDLAWRWNQDSITGNLVKRLCHQVNNFKSGSLESAKKFHGWAICQEGKEYKHFPMPNFETVKELDHFLYIWSHELKTLKTHDEIAARWAFAGAIVLNEKFSSYDESGYKWFKDHIQKKGFFKKLTDHLKVSKSGGTNARSGDAEKLNDWFRQMENQLPIHLGGTKKDPPKKKVPQSPKSPPKAHAKTRNTPKP